MWFIRLYCAWSGIVFAKDFKARSVSSIWLPCHIACTCVARYIRWQTCRHHDDDDDGTPSWVSCTANHLRNVAHSDRGASTKRNKSSYTGPGNVCLPFFVYAHWNIYHCVCLYVVLHLTRYMLARACNPPSGTRSGTGGHVRCVFLDVPIVVCCV